MIWYLQDLQRARQEREALEALASNAEWLSPIGWRIDASLRLIWDADILTSASTFPISLRYPNHFPHSPPLVIPRGDSARWSEHQYGPGGELCLEYGPDNWHQEITGAEMVLSAFRLLQGERPAPDQRATVASRHRTTLGQGLRSAWARFMMTPSFDQFLKGLSDEQLLSGNMACIFHEETLVCLFVGMTIADGKEWTDPAVPASLVRKRDLRPASLLRLSANTTVPLIKSVTDLRALVGQSGFTLPEVSYAFVTNGSKIKAWYLDQDDDTVIELSVINADAAAARLDKDHTILNARKVALVGCGSLGSKLAVMLARSGVGKFLLVDDDILFPSNLVRHDLDWRDVAVHKVDGVAQRIQLVNSAAICEKRKHKLGGQESSGSIESLIESLSSCDLVIDMTADPSVFNYLCAAVAIGKKPLLWAEVFAGGFGGLLARHRPSIEPDPASMRRSIENWCYDRGKPIERATSDYGGGAAAPLIADDADVTVIAAHAARMAIDTLIGRNPSVFPNSVYMIGLAYGGNGFFNAPFETYPIDVGLPPTPQESPETMTPEERKNELNRIAELFKDHENATSPTEANPEAPSA